MLQGDSEPAIQQILNSVVACRARSSYKDKSDTPRLSCFQWSSGESSQHCSQRGSYPQGPIGDQECCTRTLAHICMAPSSCSLRPQPLLRWFARRSYLRSPTRAKVSSSDVGFWRVMFFKPTKYKGDLQWKRGIWVWVGLSEKNGAHVLLTPEQ